MDEDDFCSELDRLRAALIYAAVDWRHCSGECKRTPCARCVALWKAIDALIAQRAANDDALLKALVEKTGIDLPSSAAEAVSMLDAEMAKLKATTQSFVDNLTEREREVLAKRFPERRF